MTIVADPDAVAADCNEPLDIMGVRNQSRNPMRLEHDDFTAFRLPKIIGHTIYEQAVSADGLQVENLFSAMKYLTFG